MSEETKKAPAIRFQGFTDDWEQRKLGDTFEFSVSTNSLSRAQLNYEKGNIKSIHYGDILIKYNSILEITKDKIPFITNGSIEKYKPNLLENGDVVFADAAEDETVGKAVEINGISDEYVVAGLHTIVARPKEKMAKYFSGYYINADVYQRQLLRLMQGTKVSSISKGNLKKTIVAYPKNLAEQQKIGSFFKQLDDTIALHQRMSDKQKKLKANLLQMMFPRNGEKIPEVRLAGFVEDWSQRTLEDISDKVTEKNKAREFTETLTNSAEYGIISQSDYFDKDISNINNINGYYVVRPDDFVYNPRISNFAPVGPIKRNNLNRIGIMSPLYYVFRPKRVDHTFLEKYFETSYWHIFMKMNGDSGARADRFAIKDTILKEMPIPYPIMEEQVKIGIFFNQLDKSIVLHQEKIAHLKILKSTLLNKMFI